MRKTLYLVLLLLLISAAFASDPFAQELPSGDDWRGRLGLGNEKVTNLHFYFHDTVSGNAPTALRVAQAATTNQSSTLFGMVVMIDDKLTVGQDPNSTEIGRAQGTYSSASQGELGLLMSMYFSFTSGKYNGSSISILGRNHALRPVREIPVVGGSGLFRLARGVALARNYMFNPTTGDAIVEYNVTVVHYEVTDDSRFQLNNSDVSAALQSLPLLCSSWFGLLVVVSGVMFNLCLP